MQNSRRRIGMGLVGPGFVATHHLDAVRRLGDVEPVAIAASTQESADRKAAALHVRKAYGRYQDLLDDPEVEVVHNTTPNYLHFEVSMAAIRAGKHLISDKPLAMTPGEGAALRDAAQAAGVANAVTFNYRGNPMVQQARSMAARDDIGAIFFVHGHYLQDWLTDDHAYSWRLDPAKGGASSALADIGSHWCDLAQHVAGSEIVEVLADITTVVNTRYTSEASSEAFSGRRDQAAQATQVSAEDLASVLLRFANGARGCFSVGQVLPGHKNGLELELNGRTGSLRWNQETQNELWIGRHDSANCVLARDPSLLLPEARPYAHLPGGHQEGWADAFRNVIGDAYEWIRHGAEATTKPLTICTFADACQVSCVIDAMLRSHASGGVWTQVLPADNLP